MRCASPPESVPGGAVEREVVQADVDEEAQPLVDLLQDPLGDRLVPVAERHLPQEVGAFADRHRGDLGDRLPLHGHREHDRLQAGALTGRAGHLAHVALEALPAAVGLRLLVPALDEGHHALERRRVRPLTPVPVAVAHLDLRLVPVQQRLLGALRQPCPGDVRTEAERVGERADEAAEVVPGVPVRPGVQRALVERLLLVRDDQLRVDLHAGADAGAVRAGAEGGVEGEGARLQLLERQVVVRAVEVLGEHPLALRIVLVEVDEVEDHHAAGQPERGLDGVGEPPLRALLDREAVDDHLDRVLLLLLQLRRLGELDRLPVDARPAVALRLKLVEEVDELALALAHQRREHLEAAARLQAEHPVDDRLRRLPGDGTPALGAVRLADAREEQPQVVVDLGDGADGRTGVARGRLLVDGDRGGQALDEVHVGLVHLTEELPGVGGKRLHVAPLALGEDRVEGERRLARPREPGEDDERVARKVDRDVPEIVLASATDEKTVRGHAGWHLSCGMQGAPTAQEPPTKSRGGAVRVCPGSDPVPPPELIARAFDLRPPLRASCCLPLEGVAGLAWRS